MAFLGREYKFHSQENFDNFLRAVGVPEDQVAKYLEFKPTSKLEKHGDTYKYISVTPEGTRETSFKSGVEFDDVMGQSKVPIKTTYTVNGNKVSQIIKSDLGVGTFDREYVGDDLIVTLKSSKWDGVATRIYKAV